jgi:predicted AlkP superfamily pyrophosphatase or phosphodiesterase
VPKFPWIKGLTVSLAGLAGLLATSSSEPDQQPQVGQIRHVLLISIDGFHAVDLANCTAAGTCPNLESLTDHGTTYTNASTTKPSDSFPGLLAQLTGGTPKTTGVFYDDSYDRRFFPPGSNCSGVPVQK